jgi:hypothetical protein
MPSAERLTASAARRKIAVSLAMAGTVETRGSVAPLLAVRLSLLVLLLLGILPGGFAA